ncbi:hypothetical protein HYY75_05060, partial [bacterium]|nr:hypothetical protein [bacterium]
MNFFQLGVFWVHLFSEMGFNVLISPETNTSIVDQGIEVMTCESCFPVKISHGHVRYLKNKTDYLFLPLMIEMEAKPDMKGYYCPYLEANTYMLQAALDLDQRKIIMPALYLNKGKEAVKSSIQGEFQRLGLPFDSFLFEKAHFKARQAMSKFDAEIKRIGAVTLAGLKDSRAIVVVGRPYNAYDSRTNLNLFAAFSRLGVIAIPQDFLDIEKEEINEEYPNMFWGFGNKILKAAKFINNDPRLFGLYLTSFACGPDSFILHFFNHEMCRTNRPYLELELDEHSAGAGVETRLLAFLDAIKNQKKVRTLNKDVHFISRKSSASLSGRTLYIPKMAAISPCLAAAFEGVGRKAKVMPTYTKTGLEFGKSATSGKECFPCIVTTGDMVDLINNLRKQGE